jgi:hypothetical protein
MSNEHASDRDSALVRRFAAGDAALIGELEPLLDRELATIAKQIFRRHHVRGTVYAEDDAINDAKLALYQAARTGRLGSVRTIDELLRFVRALLERQVLREWDHESALKRGGPGSRHSRSDRQHVSPARDPTWVRGVRRTSGSLDKLDSHTPSPDDLTIVKLDCERLIERLNDPVLETIIRMRIDQRTTLEIARLLGKPLSFVERKLRLIRSMWMEINPSSH